MWKKNISFFFVGFLFLLCEIIYITSIDGTDTVVWYKCINYFYVILWALPALVMLGYIIFMRIYMPKAKKNTQGIIFYVINANAKQNEAIRNKLIAQLEKAVNTETPEYSVVVIDDYHSQKYFPILNAPIKNNGGEAQANILKKRRGCIAILIDCINGGDGEDLFCHMNTTVGITYNNLPPKISEYLIRDVSAAFSPLREVDIMKLTETTDLSQYSIAMDVVCKYILASISFHCGNFLDAINLLHTIEKTISRKKDLPESIVPIKNVLGDRLAVSYSVQAEYEYQKYCSNYDIRHLVEVRKALSNEYLQMRFSDENKILEGICCFVLDRDVDCAIRWMNSCDKKQPVIKYNKIFLTLYKSCTTTNVFKTYNLYKSFAALPYTVQEQIESFTFNEYMNDQAKKQLLLILFFIYDFQNNTILAKRCLEKFCIAFPWVFEGKLSSIFNMLNEKYADIKYNEEEEYSI